MNLINKLKFTILLTFAVVFLLQLTVSSAAVTCSTGSECPDSYFLVGEYCQGNNLYQNKVTYSCINSVCVSNKSPYLLQSCTNTNKCEAGLWYTGCASENSSNSSNINNTSNSACYNRSYQKCIGSSVYWFDSCNNQQDLYRSCSADQICYNGACIANTYTPSQTTPVPVYAPPPTPTYPYVIHAVKGCIDNKSYWYDSIGTKQDLYENCNLTNATCYDGKCLNVPRGTAPKITTASTPRPAPVVITTTTSTCPACEVCATIQEITPPTQPELQTQSQESKISTTAAVSGNNFLIELIKKWYGWIIAITILITVLVIVFMKASSKE